MVEDDNTGHLDFEAVSTSTSKPKRHTTTCSVSSGAACDEFENVNNATKLSMLFEEILNLKADQSSTKDLISISTNT